MHPLNKLLALNKGRGFFRAEKQSDDQSTLYLYDVIVSDPFWGGVDAETFVKTLNSIKEPVIHLRINSPGGDVFAAQAMAMAVREHPSKIIAHVDGYAASAATFPVISADESYINKSGMFMIHNAWTIAMGNAEDLIEQAGLLERIDNILAADYAVKAGKTIDEVRAWMAAETYFFGQEAVDAGFVNAVSADAVKNKLHWDLSAYANPPETEQTENDNQLNKAHAEREFGLVMKCA